jgi:NAD(P)-dependent dehydrogenase (short-subunit alcohol dehydrogenase family)
MHELFGYAGKRVVVCGCTSGMGEATARALVDMGADVTGLDVKPTAVPVARFIDIDLGDQPAIAGATDQVDGVVDALFICSGLPGDTDWPAIDVVTVNFLGPRELIERLVPQMQPGAGIVSISSVAGRAGIDNFGTLRELLEDVPEFGAGRAWCEAHPDLLANPYGFSKQCITAYTAWRSYGLITERGVRINCISPGPTTTPMWPHFERGAGKQYMAEFPRPIGRNSTPSEQAAALLFLNSAAASYITGENLFTDGGFMGALLTGQLDPAKLARPAPAAPTSAG